MLMPVYKYEYVKILYDETKEKGPLFNAIKGIVKSLGNNPEKIKTKHPIIIAP